MMRIPWTAKKTNEEVLTESQTTRQLMTKIRKRQAKFVGHVIRRNQLEHLVTTGKFDGKERQRNTKRKDVGQPGGLDEHWKTIRDDQRDEL